MTKEEIEKQFEAIKKQRGNANKPAPKLVFTDPLYHKARVLEGAGMVSADKPLPSASLVEKAKMHAKKLTGKMPSKKSIGAVAAGLATGYLGAKAIKKEAQMVAQVIGKEQMKHSNPKIDDNLVPVKKIDHKKTKEVVHSKAEEDFDKIKSKAKKGGATAGAILGAAPSALAGIAAGETFKVKNPKALGLGVAAASLAASAGLTSKYVGHKADKKKDEITSKMRMRNTSIREHLRKRKGQGAHVFANPSILAKGEY